ncbi:MAG: aminotransferase class III-fold pyridoxal phosphate-dependent enzyme [Phycisphaeraceae bacterium]|nr:MAG: aminotransferase class III-fold pyridoxal phosphate-dependent enzyme [Phycisphaeraceae bacterium]
MTSTKSAASGVSSGAEAIGGAGVGGPSGSTVGAALRASPAVASAVAALVAEAKRHSARITDVRPADPGLKTEYEALMKRAAEVRGRGLLYPYIGSGVGHGALVELADGSVKWDMITGIGVHFFGHSDPEMIGLGVESGLDDVLKHGNLVTNFEAYGFGETLLAEAKKGSRLRHAYVSTSGAMANENALKVCYQKAGGLAPRVIAFKDCFMGRSVTMCQIGDTSEYRQGVPLSTLVDYMPFWDEEAAARMGKARYIDMGVQHLEMLLDRYPGQHACFIFELVQGEGGFNVGDRDYFKALMDLCRARKVAIWDDEIQTFGRTERMFAYEMLDLGDYVDVFCVGKMTQACVTMFTEEFNPKAGLLSGTFTGEGVSFRWGTRVVERLRDGDYYGPDGRFAKHHAAFRSHVSALAAKHPAWFPKVVDRAGYERPIAGGVGGMMRFTPFGGKKDKIAAACKACFDEGLITFWCGHGPYHMRMLPPLPVMKMEDWPRVFACLERGLAKVG